MVEGVLAGSDSWVPAEAAVGQRSQDNGEVKIRRAAGC
jgi:hypothetical protein